MPGPHPDKPGDAPEEPERHPGQPEQAPPGEPASGFPEPPGPESEEREGGERTPHSGLSNPADDPDPTEWPDPYEKRPDPRDPSDPDHEPFGEGPHVDPGAVSTSEPHPSQDPEAEPWEGPKRDKVDK